MAKMNKPSYWQNITAINDRQEDKGIETYGQRIEDNDAVQIVDRLTMLEEELVDGLKYIEWVKDWLSEHYEEGDRR